MVYHFFCKPPRSTIARPLSTIIEPTRAPPKAPNKLSQVSLRSPCVVLFGGANALFKTNPFLYIETIHHWLNAETREPQSTSNWSHFIIGKITNATSHPQKLNCCFDDQTPCANEISIYCDVISATHDVFLFKKFWDLHGLLDIEGPGDA